MEPIVSSETSAIRTQTPGNYPKRNNLHLEHGESLRKSLINLIRAAGRLPPLLNDVIQVHYILLFLLEKKKKETDRTTENPTDIYRRTTNMRE